MDGSDSAQRAAAAGSLTACGSVWPSILGHSLRAPGWPSRPSLRRAGAPWRDPPGHTRWRLRRGRWVPQGFGLSQGQRDGGLPAAGLDRLKACDLGHTIRGAQHFIPAPHVLHQICSTSGPPASHDANDTKSTTRDIRAMPMRVRVTPETGVLPGGRNRCALVTPIPGLLLA